MPKDTDELEHELKDAGGLEGFLAENEGSLRRYTLREYLSLLLAEKGLNKNDVIKKSGLERLYGYHIFAGRRKKPSREKMLALAFAMQLSPEETQRLLYYAGDAPLYVRNRRDSVIWYALNRHLNVIETNILLEEMNEQPIS